MAKKLTLYTILFLRTTNNMLKKYFPLFILAFVFSLVFLTNFSNQGFLTGWDNLETELNIGLNIKRAIFGVWQQYQGLGLLAGNAHAADLPRQILTLILSIVIPTNLIRQFYVFLMLFLGLIGSYFLLKTLFLKENDLQSKLIATLGSLFYLFNLSTIQTFYVPFEPFITSFGLLPFLILSTFLFIKNNTKKNFIFLIIVNLIAISQSQVPTVFLINALIISIVIISINLKEKNKFVLKNSISALLITAILNSFWLLPFLYFVLTNSGVAINAKINQMTTETVFAQNKAFGSLKDVMLLKGFWFNNVDPNLKGKFEYMLFNWRNYFSNPLINLIGYFFSATILLGLISSLKKINSVTLSFLALFTLGFTMLCVDTKPFSYIDSVLRQIPLINEVFRFPFTKFSILLSLSYSVFFALGVKFIYKILLKINKSSKVNIFFLFFLFTSLLFIFIFPIFTNNLFYYKNKVTIPKEYFQTFDYFKKQNPNTRIANFPQPTFWGWSYYKWGYGGSGFIWYGINQPILDRAFDVWSKYNENYYWEMSDALYSKDSDLLNKVINKYQINWIILDKNVIYPPSPVSLFNNELASMLENDPDIQKTKSFGNIDIYKVNLNNKVNNFVFSLDNLNSANSYNLGSKDQAYSDLGNYVSNSKNNNYFYPFRSIFSNKREEDKEFVIKNEDNYILLDNPVSETYKQSNFIIQSFAKEDIIAADFIKERNKNGTVTLSAVIKTPQINLINKSKNKKTILYLKTLKIPLLDIPANYKGKINININGVKDYKVNAESFPNIIGTSFLITKQDNIITVNIPNLTNTKTISPDMILGFLGNEESIIVEKIEKNSFLEIQIPKINDGYQSFEKRQTILTEDKFYNCNYFNQGENASSIVKVGANTMLRLESENSTSCISFYVPDLIHNQSYSLFIESVNEKGRPLHFWVENEDEKYSPIDTYLEKNTSFNKSSFVIPPQEEFGRAYSLHFDNISLNKDKTINYLGNIYMYLIPYNFISSLKFSLNTPIIQSKSVTPYVIHENEYKYVVTNPSPEIIVLSQAFDKGWMAYTINKSDIKIYEFIKENLPFIFGKEIKDHVLINNWENGWEIKPSEINHQKSIIVMIFLPQYLEFLGFILIIAVFITLASIKAKNKLKSAAKLDIIK